MKAAIVSLAGPELLPGEAALLEAHPPAGIILFTRNIAGALPLARLVGDLREVLPQGALLLVDQEGGRVARLRPPDWLEHPPARIIGEAFAADPARGARLAWLTGGLIGLDCAEAGFDVVCAPVLDVWEQDATAAIGDRSYGNDPTRVATLGQAFADGVLGAGLQPVGKHVPGHGRAPVDSHVGLPRVGAEVDLAPELSVFAASVGLPWMMTAHVVYESLDPDRPATLSPIVIEGVVRGAIGFDGVLVSDDLAMGALAGPPGELARMALAAGCDIAMHCSGREDDAAAVLGAVPDLSHAALARMARGRALADRSRLQLDRRALIADREGLLA